LRRASHQGIDAVSGPQRLAGSGGTVKQIYHSTSPEEAAVLLDELDNDWEIATRR